MGRFDFAAAKLAARRVVHDTLAVPAVYEDDSMNAPVAIFARNHTRIELNGDLDRGGYAQVIEGVDRIILIPGDTPTLNFTRGGVVTFVDNHIDMTPIQAFTLDTREPKRGPLEEVWNVSAES